jgi:hypothetical protein
VRCRSRLTPRPPHPAHLPRRSRLEALSADPIPRQDSRGMALESSLPLSFSPCPGSGIATRCVGNHKGHRVISACRARTPSSPLFLPAKFPRFGAPVAAWTRHWRTLGMRARVSARVRRVMRRARAATPRAAPCVLKSAEWPRAPLFTERLPLRLRAASARRAAGLGEPRGGTLLWHPSRRRSSHTAWTFFVVFLTPVRYVAVVQWSRCLPALFPHANSLHSHRLARL